MGDIKDIKGNKKLIAFSSSELKDFLNQYIVEAASRRCCLQARIFEDALLFAVYKDKFATEEQHEFAKSELERRYPDLGSMLAASE